MNYKSLNSVQQFKVGPILPCKTRTSTVWSDKSTKAVPLLITNSLNKFSITFSPQCRLSRLYIFTGGLKKADSMYPPSNFSYPVNYIYDLAMKCYSILLPKMIHIVHFISVNNWKFMFWISLNFINSVFWTRHLCDFRSSCDRVSQVEHEPTRRHNLENHMPTKRNKPPPWQKNLDVRNERDRHRDKPTDRQTWEKFWCHFFMVFAFRPPSYPLSLDPVTYCQRASPSLPSPSRKSSLILWLKNLKSKTSLHKMLARKK